MLIMHGFKWLLLLSFFGSFSSFLIYNWKTAENLSRENDRGLAVRGQLSTSFGWAILVQKISFDYLQAPLSSIIITLLYLILFAPLPARMLTESPLQ